MTDEPDDFDTWAAKLKARLAEEHAQPRRPMTFFVPDKLMPRLERALEALDSPKETE